MKKLSFLILVILFFFGCEKENPHSTPAPWTGSNNNGITSGGSIENTVWAWQKVSLTEDWGYINYANQQVQTYYNFQEVEATDHDDFDLIWYFRLDNTAIIFEYDGSDPAWYADTLQYTLIGDSIYFSEYLYGGNRYVINTLNSQNLDISSRDYSTLYEPEFNDTTFYYDDVFNIKFISSQLPVGNIRSSSQKPSNNLFFKKERKIN